MTVAEMIELLKDCDPSAEVRLQGAPRCHCPRIEYVTPGRMKPEAVGKPRPVPVDFILQEMPGEAIGEDFEYLRDWRADWKRAADARTPLVVLLETE